MKKRLLFVNDEMVMGGVARILISLLNKLDLSQLEVDLLVLNPHGELMSEIPKGIRVLDSSLAFQGVDVVLQDALKRRDVVQVVQKLKLLAKMKFGNMQRFIQAERAKLSLGVYDIEIAAKEGFCSIFVAYGASKRTINWIHVDYAQANYSQHHMDLMKTVLKEIDVHIAVSNQAKHAYENLFNVHPVISIPNVMDTQGIELKLKETSKLTLPKAGLNLITVGRMHPQKAMHRAIEALIECPKDTHLSIIGDGLLRSELEALVIRHHLEAQVTFFGQLSNPFPLLKQADLFLLPSKYEGYPTTVIESFMSGVPVLSCLVAGVDQQIQEGINGWVVSNDSVAFKKQLLFLVQNPKLISSARKNLKGYFYDNTQHLARFMAVLEGNL